MLAGIFVAWVGVVEARLVYLHVIQHGALLERADEQQQSRQLIPAPRGEIVARDGSPLAVSRPRLRARGDALARSPIPSATAARLCGVLHDCDAADRQALAKQLRWSGRGRPLRVPAPQAGGRRGRGAARRSTSRTCASSRCRSAPTRAATTAAHLIGYTTSTTRARPASSWRRSRCSPAAPGLQLVVKSPLRGHSRLLTRLLRAPVPGATIETTIDRELQFIVERELADGGRASTTPTAGRSS